MFDPEVETIEEGVVVPIPKFPSWSIIILESLRVISELSKVVLFKKCNSPVPYTPLLFNAIPAFVAPLDAIKPDNPIAVKSLLSRPEPKEATILLPVVLA